MVNKVILLGRLGQDPVLKAIPSTSVCNFSLATSETYTKDGEKKEKTEWHRVVVFGKLADLCSQYLSKGRQAFVEGKIQTRSWDDKDGSKRYATEIIANNVKFIGPSDNTSNSNKQELDNTVNMAEDVFNPDELPF